MHSEKKIGSMSLVLSGLAFFISLVAVYLAIQTYRAAYRPYVGVIGAKYFTTVDGPPKGIKWAWTVKNVGTVPALITSTEQTVIMTFNKKRQTTTEGPHREKRILMPGQENQIRGSVFDDPKRSPEVQNILSGNIPLEVLVEIYYKSQGVFWGQESYTYKSTYELSVDPPVGFILARGDAD